MIKKITNTLIPILFSILTLFVISFILPANTAFAEDTATSESPENVIDISFDHNKSPEDLKNNLEYINKNIEYEKNSEKLIIKKFIGDPNVTKITITPDSNSIEISDDCFKNLTNLKEFLIIPGDNNSKFPTLLNNRCFYNCTNLEYLKLNIITQIGEDNFYGCNNLSGYFAINNLTLGTNTFSNMSDNIILNLNNCVLTEHFINKLNHLKKGNNYGAIIDAADCDIQKRAFHMCSNINSVSLYNCSGIGDEAFAGCNCVVYFYPVNCNSSGIHTMNIGSRAFTDVKAILSPYVVAMQFLPPNTGTIAEDAFLGFDYSKSPIYYVNDNDYSNVKGLQKYPSKYHNFIIGSDESDPDRALISYVGDLGNINIPAEIDGVPTRLNTIFFFHQNSIIGNVIFPSNVTDIVDGSFTDLKFDGQLNLDNIKTVGKNSFRNTKGLSEAMKKGTKNFKPEVVGEKGFYACNISNENIDLSALRIIGADAFKESNITGNIELKYVEKIGKSAFLTNNFKDTNIYIQNSNAVLVMPISYNPVHIPYSFNLFNLKNEDGSVFKGTVNKDYIFTGDMPIKVKLLDQTYDLTYNCESKKISKVLTARGYNIKLVDKNNNKYLADLSDYTFNGLINNETVQFETELEPLPSVKVIYKDGDNILKSDIKYTNEDDSIVAAPDAPAKKEYNFIGWDKNVQENGDIVFTPKYKSIYDTTPTSDNFKTSIFILGLMFGTLGMIKMRTALTSN